MMAHAAQATLLDLPAELPHGLVFERDFLSATEEAELLEWFATLPFREARFKTYYARRRVVSFHSAAALAESYDSTSDDDLAPMGPPPPAIERLRERVAAFAGKHDRRIANTPESFVHVLVSEYPAGTPIGWHRDKPQYGVVAGISLGARARMRFRPLPAPGEWTRVDPKSLIVLDLEPRSIYLMRGDIRWRWQHSILPTKELRYSVTMRTLADDR
jgi:alkylated DNA repair dioxygenase AlkB